MISIFRISMIGALLAVLTQAASLAGQAAEEIPEDTRPVLSHEPDPLYRFEDYLSSSESSILSEGEEKARGGWHVDRFVFPVGEAYTQIGLFPATFEGIERNVIYFNPVPNMTRRLVFHKVPLGSTLLVRYGLDDTEGTFPEDSHIYLRIWVGRNEIHTLRILNEKGWKQERIDLGVSSMLRQRVTVTFETYSDGFVGRRFSFLAEIQK